MASIVITTLRLHHYTAAIIGPETKRNLPLKRCHLQPKAFANKHSDIYKFTNADNFTFLKGNGSNNNILQKKYCTCIFCYLVFIKNVFYLSFQVKNLPIK